MNSFGTDNSNNAARLAQMIQDSANTVFFGGAGVSTESGIPDFRSESGLYKAKQVYGYPPEDLLSYTFFTRNTEVFFKYYRENLVAAEAKPNDAHIALAGLEKHSKLQAVITQNIDGLHQAAGSVNVFELHGSNHRQYCMKCRRQYTLGYVMGQDSIVPVCEKCGGIVRPDVVLYEEPLNSTVMQAAIEAVTKAELLIVGGTSLSVYPAAGLLHYFRGSMLVLVNKSPTSADSSAQLVIRGSIAVTLKTVWELIRPE